MKNVWDCGSPPGEEDRNPRFRNIHWAWCILSLNVAFEYRVYSVKVCVSPSVTYHSTSGLFRRISSGFFEEVLDEELGAHLRRIWKQAVSRDQSTEKPTKSWQGARRTELQQHFNFVSLFGRGKNDMTGIKTAEKGERMLTPLKQ